MGQSEEIEGPGSRIKEGLDRVVEREVLPFDHTDLSKDVTFKALRILPPISQVVLAAVNSVIRKQTSALSARHLAVSTKTTSHNENRIIVPRKFERGS